MTNPILAEVWRGSMVESRHTGAYVVCDSAGRIVESAGNIASPVYPRSAIKAFQCLPMMVSGAAEKYGLTDEEIALCCASHSGEADHLRVARSILAKCGAVEADYECGAHWPASRATQAELIKADEEPRSVHNNCSGKHAGMLALSHMLGADSHGYIEPSHPVQQSIAGTLEEYCGVSIGTAPVAIDGCSVPTWAMPLRQLALGFARFGASDSPHCRRIVAAVRAHPHMVAGTGGFDTMLMQSIPRLFIKGGAEGVSCGAIPHAGLGFALKIDDGTSRGAEVAVAMILARLDIWTSEEHVALSEFASKDLINCRKRHVGVVRATA